MAWPSVVESFFISFTGMIDTMMVSTISSSAVAAVGLTTQPKFIGLATFIALTVATSAIIARRKGEERRSDANKSLLAILGFAIITTFLISFLCVTFADPVIKLCGSADDTHSDAVLYFRIIMGCIIFNTISMTINSAQRGSGNTKLAMRTNVVSSIVNIIFNYLLIGGNLGFPALGIRGAAIATVLGSVVACIMSILSLFDSSSFVSIPYCVKEKIFFSVSPLVPVFKLGSSVFLEQLLLRVGFMATAIMAAKLGTAPMAAHQVGMNILGLCFSFGDGFQAASVALIGQSLGRKDPKQANRYGIICQLCGLAVAICISILLLVGGRFFYGLFFEEENIIEIGVSITRMIVLIVLFQIPQVVFTGSLRGAGDVLYTTMTSTISVTFVRTIVSYICCFVLGWGMVGIWCGVMADQSCRFILNSLRYRSGKWMKIII
ncbi:MAG: MATE family efflux transporter [Lachnospiraceae bacterium]|nr:MATE family efflux transporter [Lachnospiraceae bacterium]